MRNLILALVAFFALAVLVSPAHSAAMIAQAGSTTVVLTTEPCTSEKVKKAHPDVNLEKHGTARVTYQGRFIEACWTVDQEHGMVDIVDAEGDKGSVGMQYFRPVTPI